MRKRVQVQDHDEDEDKEEELSLYAQGASGHHKTFEWVSEASAR